MSDKERLRKDDCSTGDGGGGGGSGGEDEDEEEPKAKKDPEEKTRRGFGRNGRRVSLFRWTKGKRHQRQRMTQKGISVNSGCWGRSGSGEICLKQPRTADSSGESPTSDPNSPEFTFGMLRTLIEKNDFYSKDCNPHIDSGD